MDNVLLLGNGFSRMLFKDMPAWKELFSSMHSQVKNYTILYEICWLNSAGVSEADKKKELAEKIKESVSAEKINWELKSLREFGEKLKKKHIYNIITTNYDNGIDILLCDICGYKAAKKTSADEKVYSIRTYTEYENKKLGHKVKIWKIHGEFNRIASIMFGYDQYCGALSKLSQYIKGSYKSSSKNGPMCKTSIMDKCRYNEFDGVSWAELFFNSNVYIAGFGMDFSEIDLWWLLNKRARIKKELSKISNKICYLYNKKYDNREEKKDIFEALEAFDVGTFEIDWDEDFINNIFDKIL